MGKPWFGAKAYGIGIGPKGVGGWLSVLIYTLAVISVVFVPSWFNVSWWIVGLILLVLTVALFVLVALKNDGEPWRWRWGND